MKAANDPRRVWAYLTQQGQWEAHTLFACPRCDERHLGQRHLGQRRCPDCGVFGTALGLGARCSDRGELVLLTDL